MRHTCLVAMLAFSCIASIERLHAQNPYCGDGTCNTDGCPAGGMISPGNGCQEDQDSCAEDCFETNSVVTSLPFVQFPDDGVPWRDNYRNWPDPDEVDGCFGNCGPGCFQWHICGSPEHYWQWSGYTSPIYYEYEGDGCLDDDMVHATFYGYMETGTWTYHGWVASGCTAHDATCRWPLVAFLFATCYVPVSWAAGGACLGAHADTWTYETTMITYNTSNVQVTGPGQCYNGPPKCGDNICQTEGCHPGGGGTPGDGCQEESANCGDCG